MIQQKGLIQNSWLLALPALLYFILVLVTESHVDSVIYLTILVGIGLFSWLLFFELKWYFVFLILLIPVSQDVFITESAKVNFPSELFLVPFVCFLVFFVKDYSKGFIGLIKHPITILILLDILIGLVSSLFSDYMDVGLKRVVLQSLFFLGFFAPIVLFKDSKRKFHLWLAYAIGLIPVMYFTLKTHMLYDFNPRVVFSICQPYFNDHTVYGACLAFIIPFLVILVRNSSKFSKNYGVKVFLFVLLGGILISEFLALSRAAILSLVAAFLFYLVLKLKLSFRLLLTVLATLFIVVLTFSSSIYESILENEVVSNDGEISNHFSSVTNVNNDASNLERINRWVCAYRMFESKPMLGYGPGVYQFEYNQFQSFEYKTYISTNMGDRGNAHSEYLSALSEKGILGGSVFVLIVFVSIAVGMKNHYLLDDGLTKLLNLAMILGLVTFFFHAVFNAFLDQSKMAFLVYSALATIVIINLQLKNESH